MTSNKYGRRYIVMCYDCDYLRQDFIYTTPSVHRHRKQHPTHEVASLTPDLLLKEYPSIESLRQALPLDPSEPPF